MKPIILARVIIFVIPPLFLLPSSLLAQWGPERRLTDNDSSSYSSLNYARSVAASRDNIHVVYYGKRDGNRGIFYKRSSDRGNTWGPETSLEKGTAQVRYPSVAASGTGVYVVWEDKRGKVLNVFIKRSLDGGLSWGPETQLTDDSTDSVCPMVAASKAAINVVWQNYKRDPFMPGISCRRSTDGGKAWRLVTPLCRDLVFSDHPSMIASGPDVHLVWEWGAKREGTFRVGYLHSSDEGKTWEPETFSTPDTMISYSPTIAVAGTVVHLVWEERKLKNYFLHYKKSTDRGKTWGQDTILAPVSTVEPEPTIAASGSRVFLLWNDNREGHWGIYGRTSTDSGKTWGPEVRLTPKTSDASAPSAVYSGSTAHVVWSEKKAGDWQIYYQRISSAKP